MAAANEKRITETDQLCIECLRGENRLTINGGIVCPSCNKECCVRCFGVDFEREFPYGDEHPPRYCLTCEQDVVKTRRKYALNNKIEKCDEMFSVSPSTKHSTNKKNNVYTGKDNFTSTLSPFLQGKTKNLPNRFSDRNNGKGMVLCSKSCIPTDQDNRYSISSQPISVEPTRETCLNHNNFEKLPFSKSFRKISPNDILDQRQLSLTKDKNTHVSNCMYENTQEDGVNLKYYQFYNETITYPSSSEVCFQNNGQEQTVYDHGDLIHGKQLLPQRNSINCLKQNANVDDEEVDNPDCPFNDEIPYALILTGKFDEEVLRAKQKKTQQQAFNKMKERQGKLLLCTDVMETKIDSKSQSQEKNNSKILSAKFQPNVPFMANNAQKCDTNCKETTAENCRKPDPNDTHDSEPIIMKVLRQQAKIKKMKDSREPQFQAHRNSNTAANIQPVAMEFIRRNRILKKKAERQSDPLCNISCPFDKEFISIFQNMFGNNTDKHSDTGTVLPTNTNRSTDSFQPKRLNKINKNMFPNTPKRGERYETKHKIKEQKKSLMNTDQEISTKRESSKPKVTDNHSSQSASVLRRTEKEVFKIDLEHLNKAAVERHLAFQNIKHSKFKMKCSSCGRPECKSNQRRKMADFVRISKQAGFEVHDVTFDGNCMFAAVVDQLQIHGDNSFDPKALRETAVSWLIENPNNSDGTPFASFVSDKWDVYLQKMIAEGEWGDHLTLRAIAEVLHRTIKVLSDRDGESNWTILKPMTVDECKDETDLVLGHIGEFHYTSLRPADIANQSLKSPTTDQSLKSLTEQDVSDTDDNNQTSITGDENIEMFRDDYIDTFSDIPSAHFSFLLKRVIPTKVLVSAAIMQSDQLQRLNYQDIFRLNNYECDIEFGGSVAEGVYVPLLNADIHGFPNRNVATYAYSVLKDYIATTNSPENDKKNNKIYCALDTAGVQTGYTRLMFPQSHWIYGPWLKLFLVEDTRPYYICPKNCTIAHIHTYQRIAVRFQAWPEFAQSWKVRKRLENWPQEHIMASIESEGCLLVSNNDPGLEWRFSFVLCERKLFREAVSPNQKYCYIVFDAMCTQTMNNVKSITSEHRKSVFFYACERIPGEYWETCPGGCVLYMLDELLRYIKAKYLPNYFVHTNNMVADLQDSDFNDIEEKIILLRSQPVLFIQQINDSIGSLSCETTVITRVLNDIANFKEHKSLKRSTIELFIPATLQTVHEYINARSFEQGYELLSQVFQDRLSVCTCDESVSFQMFLSDALHGLDIDSIVWFTAYTDRQLEGQLSKPLIRETCRDLQLVKIKDILPPDVVGSYGDTEVPAKFLIKRCSFCNDYAKFLFQTNKHSEILPILYYCHDIFTKSNEKQKLDKDDDNGGGNQERLARSDFTDESMFSIYSAMFAVYKKQHHLEFFRHMMPVVKGIVKRMNTRGAYSCLCYMNQDLGDTVALLESTSAYGRLPFDAKEHQLVNDFLYWPYKCKTFI